jgi:hypothetical protein
MRCCCCDRNLSDFESTLRHAITGEFLDTCNRCLAGLGIPSVGREDLDNFPPDDEVDIQDSQEYDDD